jgi:hypothetical protein
MCFATLIWSTDNDLITLAIFDLMCCRSNIDYMTLSLCLQAQLSHSPLIACHVSVLFPYALLICSRMHPLTTYSVHLPLAIPDYY